MPLSAEAVAKLRSLVDKAVADPVADIPGTTVVVVGRDGEELFAHSAGKRGVASKEAMTLDNVFWMASCTKAVAGLAIMQLVEQGVLRLDDGDQIAKLCPELTGLTVLKEDGTTEPQRKQITLRMLLSHTAGFGYSFFNERLRDWFFPIGVDEFSGRFEDMKLPLLFQPGENWQYGVSIDWAGVVLERATGLTLSAYLLKNVFGPLGMEDINMIPTPAMRANLAYMNHRQPDGQVRPRDHLMRAPLVVDPADPAAVAKVFSSGGAGLFAKPQQYARILSVFLNDGTDARTGVQLLKKSTVEEMFTNQIPQLGNYARQQVPASKADLTNAISDLYPIPNNAPQGWGLTFMLPNGDATGRSKTTAQWAGLPNLWWWADREKGVAGIICTQILPFADEKVISLWDSVERQVYAALGK